MTHSDASPPPQTPKPKPEPPAEPSGALDVHGLLQAGLGHDTNPGDFESGINETRQLAPEEILCPEDIQEDFPSLEILELLGQGGMGVVFKARQKSLDRLVALKILKSKFSADPRFAERFTREARALAKLNHPNIVGIHDFGQSGGRYYFVMEYVGGTNLRKVLQQGLMKSTEALAILPQVCEALQFAHEEGIVHRDIKPENILLDTRGRIKVADFGLAKLLGIPAAGPMLTESSVVVGTPYYMAPEQMEHPQDVDQRADVYAVGVLLYEMLTGELPVGRFMPPSKRVQVDVRLDEVVLRALEKDPEQRYQRVSDIKSEIDGIAGSSRQMPEPGPGVAVPPMAPSLAPPSSSPPPPSGYSTPPGAAPSPSSPPAQSNWQERWFWKGRPLQVWFCSVVCLLSGFDAVWGNNGSHFVQRVTFILGLVLALGLFFRYRSAFIVTSILAALAIVISIFNSSGLTPLFFNLLFLIVLLSARQWYHPEKKLGGHKMSEKSSAPQPINTGQPISSETGWPVVGSSATGGAEGGSATCTTAGRAAVEPSSAVPLLTGLATAALVFGLLSAAFGLVGLGLFLGPIAVILGGWAAIQSANHPRKYGGFGRAMIGLALGILGFVISIPAAATMAAIAVPRFKSPNVYIPKPIILPFLPGANRARSTPRNNVPSAGQLNSEAMETLLEQFHRGIAIREDVIRAYGEPQQYVWNGGVFDANNLPENYIMDYGNKFMVMIASGVVGELRHGEPGYSWQGRLAVGAPIEEALNVLGQPEEILRGGPNEFKDGVLYRDIDGQKGVGYYSRSDLGVRLFFRDEKVLAIYETPMAAAADASRWSSSKEQLDTVAAYADVRGKDLSRLDLSGRGELIPTLTFNRKTVWPDAQKMPATPVPETLLVQARNPGLGIREIHSRGITGENVYVAIIDQPLYKDHPEFAGKIVQYHDTGCESESSMHGPAVTSLLVGSQCGTAPEARVYYAAVPSWKADAAYYAKGLDWILGVNKSLPINRKIRVVSVSAAPSGPGSPFTKNQALWDAARARAEAAGILVLDCTENHGFIGACWYDAADPENVSKCTPGFPGLPESRGSGGRGILVPASPRTTAEEYRRGDFSFQYCGRGGLSWSIPYCAGVLALGWQLRPELSGNEMKDLLFQSAFGDSTGAKIIHPSEFLRLVKEATRKLQYIQ